MKRGKMTELEKAKRADRREAKKNAPCPHDWRPIPGGFQCAMCPTKARDGKVVSP